MHVVRMLWMAPVYALACWIELLLWCFGEEQFTYIAASVRRCYEAYTIYSFFCFLVLTPPS